MRRTQLYLDDELWNALHVLARQQGTTISDLVRQAVRVQYVGDLDKRGKAMRAFAGSRSHGIDTVSAEEQVRSLRRGNRLERLGRE